MSCLLALPDELAIEITGHLAVTSEHPMDDLRSLRSTCSSMRLIYGNPAISWHVAQDQCRCEQVWDDVSN